MARTRQNGLHELARDVTILDFMLREDEETVGAGRQLTLNRENIPQI
jgi:hypothetical protein